MENITQVRGELETVQEDQDKSYILGRITNTVTHQATD